MTPLLVSIILLQFVPFTTCKIVELTCPALSAPISRRRLPSKKHSSDSSDSSKKHQSHSSDSSKKHKSDSLDSSCFELNITVNVENILPDPTYILPQDNINAISDGIKSTFDDCDITIETNESDIDNKWIIDDQCDHAIDAKFTTSVNRQFVTSQFNTSCDNDTLVINDTAGTITCQLTLPESIVYVWHLQQINLKIDIESCSAVIMQSKISYNNKSSSENVIAVSEAVTVEETDESGKQYEFIFDATTNTLHQQTTYFVTFEVIDVIGKQNILSDKFEFENVECDEIITISQPSSCALGINTAVTKELAYGLHAFCNESLATPEQQLFEEILFQKHSSQTHISGDIWYPLEERRRSRNLLGGLDSGPNLGGKCLVATYSDGRVQTIANDDIFPNLNQCVAVDEGTRRVFSVGGNDTNGNALDRLAIYYLESQSEAILLDDNLKLDIPRAMTTCYYYKRNDEEYIIAANGMPHTKYVNDDDYWYNDIVFIPLDNNNKRCNFPVVKLKLNVIDMKLFVTENDILYLIGGRTGQNATNIIQIIDLDQVFDASDSSSDSYSSDVTTLTTYERMAPMNLNRVLPLADFSFVENETCMISWNGQNYINQNYVSIDNSKSQIEMYCNKLLIGYFNTTRPTLVGTSANIQFSEYDNNNLLTLSNENNIVTQESASIRHYNFENDGLWYKFSTNFKICFDDKDEVQNRMNFFTDFTIDNRQILEENILFESQKNYRDWSYGFGEVDVLNIDITEPAPCSSDSQDTKNYNRKNLRTRKYSGANANMLDMITDQTNEYYDHNMWKNIVAFGLCVVFLLWISIVCCWEKKQMYNIQ